MYNLFYSKGMTVGIEKTETHKRNPKPINQSQTTTNESIQPKDGNYFQQPKGMCMIHRFYQVYAN